MVEPTGTLQRASPSTAINMTLGVDLTLIALLWCASSIAANPNGDFPLMDDWAYGLTVKHLLDEGVYRPLGWASMTLFTNVLWGALFCLPAGFSFFALRLSTLLAALLAFFGTYLLIRDLEKPRWLALLIALMMGFNPIYYALSHTFMTDVPFTAVTVWSILFLARSLRSGLGVQMLFGAMFAVAATLSRQIALCIPIAFGITVLLTSGVNRQTVWRAITPLILCVGALFLYDHWLAASGRLPKNYALQVTGVIHAFADWRDLLRRLLSNVYTTLVYLGLFLLPVLILLTSNLFRLGRRKAVILIAMGIATLAVGMMVRAHYRLVMDVDPILMPIIGNNIDKTGIGPYVLRDVAVLKLNHIPTLSTGFWIIVTILGIGGALLFFVNFGHLVLELMTKFLRKRIGNPEAVSLFILLCGIVYLLPLFASAFIVDRYFIPLVPLFAAGLVGTCMRFNNTQLTLTKPLNVVAIAFLAGSSLYAIAGTHDYLASNRTRWYALHELTHKGKVDVRDIDGGFEFNGLYLYDPHYPVNWVVKDGQRSPWWVHRDTYQIGFGPVPGYTVMKKYSYRRWLPPGVQTIVVLRKQ